ncbi:hypothetical protein ABT063_22065 [Streptomyces sp. NPDC002838]
MTIFSERASSAQMLSQREANVCGTGRQTEQVGQVTRQTDQVGV